MSWVAVGAAGGAFLAGSMGGGGSSGTTQTNTVQNSDPWSGVQPYLQDIFPRAAQLAYRGGGAYPLGGFLTPQSQYSAQAIQQQAQTAQDPNSLVSQSQRELGKTINGDYLTIDGNPAIQAAMDASRRTVNSQFSGDNYGSSANREWLARGAASAASPLLAQERQNQLAATAMAPQLQTANTQQLAAAGAAQETRGQAEIEAQKQGFEYPWQTLQRYQGIVSGTGGGTTTGSQQSPYYTNPFANALGMGIGGLSLYNGLNRSGLLNSGGSSQPAYTGYGMQGDYQYG